MLVNEYKRKSGKPSLKSISLTLSDNSSAKHRVHTEWQWRTFHHDGKKQPWLVSVGVLGHTLSLYLPARTKLQCTLQLRGQIRSERRHGPLAALDTLPVFNLSLPYRYSVVISDFHTNIGT
jgi:hypothetical protein